MTASGQAVDRAATSLPTGDPGVDALITLAGQTSTLPVGEHTAVYRRVLDGLHRELDADPQAAVRGAES